MLNGRNQFRLHCLGVIYFKSAVSLANVINAHCGEVNPPCDMIYTLRAKILTTTQAQLAFHAPDIKAIECCGQRGRISRTKVHFTLRQQHFTIIMTELISVSAPQGCGGDVPRKEFRAQFTSTVKFFEANRKAISPRQR